MTYTPQQLADLYTLAVSAETQEKRDDGYHDETFAMDEAVMAMAEQGYPELIRVLIDQLRAAGRRPDGETPDPGLVAEHADTMEREGDMIAVPRGLLGTALGAINHPSHSAGMTIALLKAYAYQRGHELPDQPINTGLSWENYQAISDRAPVHEALQGFTEDATEDNAICLIRAIAEALRPRPRFWVDVHGYQTYLLWSEEDAVKHCNETGGLYVLPLFAGEPINCKLPEVMCRLAPESDVIEVNRLISNLKALPQKYTTSHIALEDVLEVINQLRAKP